MWINFNLGLTYPFYPFLVLRIRKKIKSKLKWDYNWFTFVEVNIKYICINSQSDYLRTIQTKVIHVRAMRNYQPEVRYSDFPLFQ